LKEHEVVIQNPPRPLPGDLPKSFSPWHCGPGRDWCARQYELVMNDQPAIDLGETYYGLWCDLGQTPPGVETEVNTHQNYYSCLLGPLLVPAVYGTDWWALPSLLILRRTDALPSPGEPIGVCRAVARSRTKFVLGGPDSQAVAAQEELRKSLPTRSIQLPGLTLDNLYEVLATKVRKEGMVSPGRRVIFRRSHVA